MCNDILLPANEVAGCFHGSVSVHRGGVSQHAKGQGCVCETWDVTEGRV